MWQVYFPFPSLSFIHPLFYVLQQHHEINWFISQVVQISFSIYHENVGFSPCSRTKEVKTNIESRCTKNFSRPYKNWKGASAIIPCRRDIICFFDQRFKLKKMKLEFPCKTFFYPWVVTFYCHNVNMLYITIVPVWMIKPWKPKLLLTASSRMENSRVIFRYPVHKSKIVLLEIHMLQHYLSSM